MIVAVAMIVGWRVVVAVAVIVFVLVIMTMLVGRRVVMGVTVIVRVLVLMAMLVTMGVVVRLVVCVIVAVTTLRRSVRRTTVHQHVELQPGAGHAAVHRAGRDLPPLQRERLERLPHDRDRDPHVEQRGDRHVASESRDQLQVQMHRALQVEGGEGRSVQRARLI